MWVRLPSPPPPLPPFPTLTHVTVFAVGLNRGVVRGGGWGATTTEEHAMGLQYSERQDARDLGERHRIFAPSLQGQRAQDGHLARPDTRQRRVNWGSEPADRSVDGCARWRVLVVRIIHSDESIRGTRPRRRAGLRDSSHSWCGVTERLSKTPRASRQGGAGSTQHQAGCRNNCFEVPLVNQPLRL